MNGNRILKRKDSMKYVVFKYAKAKICEGVASELLLFHCSTCEKNLVRLQTLCSNNWKNKTLLSIFPTIDLMLYISICTHIRIYISSSSLTLIMLEEFPDIFPLRLETLLPKNFNLHYIFPPNKYTRFIKK